MDYFKKDMSSVGVRGHGTADVRRHLADELNGLNSVVPCSADDAVLLANRYALLAGYFVMATWKLVMEGGFESEVRGNSPVAGGDKTAAAEANRPWGPKNTFPVHGVGTRSTPVAEPESVPDKWIGKTFDSATGKEVIKPTKKLNWNIQAQNNGESWHVAPIRGFKYIVRPVGGVGKWRWERLAADGELFMPDVVAFPTAWKALQAAQGHYDQAQGASDVE